MNRVEPIRSKKKIKDLKNYLLGAGNMRSYALVVFGLNTALRISDILNLKWGDVFDFYEENFKSHVYITEKKTGKEKKCLQQCWNKRKDRLSQLKENLWLSFLEKGSSNTNFNEAI